MDIVRPIIQGRDDKLIVGGVVESGCTFDAAVVRELLGSGRVLGASLPLSQQLKYLVMGCDVKVLCVFALHMHHYPLLYLCRMVCGQHPD